MWQAEREKLTEGEGLRIRLHADGERLSWGRVIELWRTASGFRAFFNDLLADLPWSAFRWETPPVTRHGLDRTFESVVLDAPELDRAANPADFAEPLERAGNTAVARFANLGGDALLVVPVPVAAESAYAQIGAFVRHAPELQRDAFWQCVGEAVHERLGDRPLWLNTAGHGVPWLHVRLDDRPKYYAHAPYRREP